MWYKTAEETKEPYVYENFLEAGEFTDTLKVNTESPIPNMASISASLDNYRILPGIRQIPMDGWRLPGQKHFYAADDQKHAEMLAERIKENGYITPLIVVVDSTGPYILEGVHRLAALDMLNIASFPAIVVVDLDDSPAFTA